MSNTVQASATRSFAVTPSDTTQLKFRALYVGSTGDIIIKHTADSPAITYASVPDGTILPVEGVIVMAATSASDIVGMDW